MVKKTFKVVTGKDPNNYTEGAQSYELSRAAASVVNFTATSGSNTTAVDTSLNLSVNMFVGHLIRIASLATGLNYYSTVVSHTSDTFTITAISGNYQVAAGDVCHIIPANNTAIYNKPFWAKSQTIARPSNTTAYAAGDVVCGDTASISATTANGSADLTGISGADIAKCFVGQTISGTNVPSNSYIIAVGTTSITINANCTGNATNTMTISSRFFTFDLATNLVPDGVAAVNGQSFKLTECFLSCSNGAATTKLNATVMLFSQPPYPTAFTDNSALALTQAEVIAKLASSSEAVNSTYLCGSSYVSQQSNMSKLGQLNASSTKLYAIVLATNAMSPASGETIIANIKGFLK